MKLEDNAIHGVSIAYDLSEPWLIGFCRRILLEGRVVERSFSLIITFLWTVEVAT